MTSSARRPHARRPISFTRDLLLGGVIAAPFLLLLVIGALSLTIGVVQTDESVFLYIGREIRMGFLPYRDLWDHKGVPIYLLGYLASLAGSYSVGFARIATFVLPLSGCLALSSSLGLRLTARFSLLLLSLSMAAYVSSASYTMTEQLEAAAVLWAIALFLRVYQGPAPCSHRGVILALAGAVLGLGALARIHTLLSLSLIVLLVLIRDTRRRSLRRRVLEAFEVLGGFVLVAGAALALLDSWIGLPFVLDGYVLGNIRYASTSRIDIALVRSILDLTLPMLAMNGLLFVLGVQGIAALPGDRGQRGILFAFLGLSALEALATFGGTQGHYWGLAFWMLSLGSALAADGLLRTDDWRSGSSRLVGHLLGASLLLTLLCASAARPAVAAVLQPKNILLAREVSRYVQPGSRLWVAGVTGAQVNWYTDTRPGTRYIYTGAGASASFDDAIAVDDLAANMPFVLVGGSWAETDCVSELVPARISDFLATRYDLVTTVRDPSTGGSYRLYRPRIGSQGSS